MKWRRPFISKVHTYL